MPPVIIGVAIAAGSYIAGATVLTAVAIGLASAALYSVATTKMPSMPGTSPQQAKQTIRTANQPFRGVFGTAILSGPMIFAEEYLHKNVVQEEYEWCGNVWVQADKTYRYVCEKRTRTVDTSKKWLHIVIPVAGHIVENITEVFFGDKKQDDWDHDYWKINIRTGTQTTANDIPQLLREVPSWTDTMIGKGVAYIHVALAHSTTHFPNGLPNIKCKVQGSILDTPFFQGFGNNAAAVIYHYLRYHFKAEERLINTDSFKNEFDISNEAMSAEVLDWNPTPIRYAIDGAFDYDESHNNVLNKMLTACGGRLQFTNGQYYLQVAAYRGPAGSAQKISLSDLNGPIDISPDTNLEDRINIVKGSHLDPESFYQPVDIEPVTNPSYVTEDGEERERDINFEYVLNRHQAHRLSNIMLKDNRFGLTMVTPLNMRGFKFNVGLPVKFDDASLGYDKLEFRVATWKVKPGSGVTLTIKQTSPDIYDDSVAIVRPKPPETNIPDPKFCYPVENLVFTPLEDYGVYDGILTWSHPDISNLRDFVVVLTSTGGEIFKYNVGRDTELRLQNMQGVEYTIAVTAYNRYSAPSVVTKITTAVGVPKPIASVKLVPNNFEVFIEPAVSGVLPANARFVFYRGKPNVNPPSKTQIDYLGEGKTFTDSGRSPNTGYHYFISSINTGAATDLYGPYSTVTTDDPKDIEDVIGPIEPGKFTWEVFAEDAFGKGISKTYNPAIHFFVGRAYNKPTEEPSLNPLDYFFSRIGQFVSDEDQAILDNLAQGKLPDGSGDLVTEDDILFKPGDKVNADDLAHDSVTADKIVSDAITTEKIAVGAVTGSEIASNAVSTNKLSAQAVTAEKIKTNTITATQIASETITSNEIKAGTIQAEDIKANTITAAQIASETITSNEIKAGTIQAEDIKAGTITAAELSANAITSDKIQANAVTTAKLDAGSVTATKIAAQAVTADKIAANSITASKLAAGAVTAEKIAVTVVEPINNFSEFGNLRGWQFPQGAAALVDEVQLDGQVARTLKVVNKTTDLHITSDRFTVDQSAIYEFRVSVYCGQSTNLVQQGFNMKARSDSGQALSVDLYHPETLAKTGTSAAPEFWKGYAKNGWRHMIAYVVGANASVESCPKSANVSHIIKLGANVRKCEIILAAYGSGNTHTTHFYSPSGIKVGSGLVIANEIRANTLISAPRIVGGDIDGTTITGASVYGGVVGGSKVVASPEKVLVLSEYNNEVYGTMDLETIISGGNKPYYGRYLLPYDYTDLRGFYEPIKSIVKYKTLFNIAPGTEQTITHDNFILPIVPYNHPDADNTLRLVKKGNKQPGSPDLEVFFKLTMRSVDFEKVHSGGDGYDATNVYSPGITLYTDDGAFTVTGLYVRNPWKEEDNIIVKGGGVHWHLKGSFASSPQASSTFIMAAKVPIQFYSKNLKVEVKISNDYNSTKTMARLDTTMEMAIVSPTLNA